MLTEFPESGKVPRIGMHSLSRDTRVWKRVITIIEGNASASTEPLMNSCTLKNHTHASIFYICILVVFTYVILLKVWCYFSFLNHSYLAVVVVYDALLRCKLNMNTFRTDIFVYSHFYLIFFCYVLTYLAPFFPSKLPIIVVFW